MRFFSLIGAIVFYFVYGLIISLILSIAGPYLSFPARMSLYAVGSLGPIIYFVAYVLKWNKGEAKFP